jgi:putative sigma-54 modulation protein
MAVPVDITVRNIELSDRLKDYVTKKVEKLDRYLDTVEEAKVDLSYVKSARSANDRQVAQLTVRGKGVLLRAEERSDDIFASVDAVLEKIHRQMERFKGKHWRGRGNGRSVAKATRKVVSEAPASPSKPLIARRKRFPVEPITEEEAVEQMAQLGHEEFFVFLNATTRRVNVLYRRRDGSYGLLDPEVD